MTSNDDPPRSRSLIRQLFKRTPSSPPHNRSGSNGVPEISALSYVFIEPDSGPSLPSTPSIGVTLVSPRQTDTMRENETGEAQYPVTPLPAISVAYGMPDLEPQTEAYQESTYSEITLISRDPDGISQRTFASSRCNGYLRQPSMPSYPPSIDVSSLRTFTSSQDDVRLGQPSIRSTSTFSSALSSLRTFVTAQTSLRHMRQSTGLSMQSNLSNVTLPGSEALGWTLSQEAAVDQQISPQASALTADNQSSI
ncbi:hypothetical protein FRC12_010459 [Ceratobasidium sp. 428]|nr:hypothetical protein FRC12_010459 [Ceratobasidium sp. 428]